MDCHEYNICECDGLIYKRDMKSSSDFDCKKFFSIQLGRYELAQGLGADGGM